MLRVVEKLKLSFYLLAASLFALVAFVPSGYVHAESMMRHDMGNMDMSACQGCGIAPIVLNENENTPPEEDRQKEPTPPTNPLFFAQFNLALLYKNLTGYFDALLAQMRPPDLTILHSNMRF